MRAETYGNGWEPMRAASTAPVPWKSPLVVLILISRDTVRASHMVDIKRQLLDAVMPGDVLLATWPGERRQDAFVVDDLAEVREVLGCAPGKPLTDAIAAYMQDYRDEHGLTATQAADVFSHWPRADVFRALERKVTGSGARGARVRRPGVSADDWRTIYRYLERDDKAK